MTESEKGKAMNERLPTDEVLELVTAMESLAKRVEKGKGDEATRQAFASLVESMRQHLAVLEAVAK